MVGQAGVEWVVRQAPSFPLQASPLAVLQEETAQGLRAHMTQVCSNVCMSWSLATCMHRMNELLSCLSCSSLRNVSNTYYVLCLLRPHLLLFLPLGGLVCARWIGVSACELSLSLQPASASTCIALAFQCHLLICDFGLLVGPLLSSWHLTVRDIRWCVTDGSLL